MKSDKKQKLNILKTLNATLPKSRFQLTDEQIAGLRSVAEVILGITAAAGIISLAVVAPNALKLIPYAKKVRKIYRHFSSKDRDEKQKISRAIYYLRTQKYVELLPNGGDFVLKLTKKGKEQILQMSFRTLSLKKEKKWDGYWWIVMADIPVDYRSQINTFRSKIKSLGMQTLQRSVWIYPFDPSNEIAFLAKYYGLDKFITTIQAKTIETEDHNRFKNYFNLK